MKKPDIGIGYRAYKEAQRLFPETKRATIALGCGRNVIHEWNRGVAPSALYLARLYELGANVIWILTGKRSKGE